MIDVKLVSLFALAVFAFGACRGHVSEDPAASVPQESSIQIGETRQDMNLSEPVRRLLESTSRQIEVTTQYTQDYFKISYPNGDVPEDTGACSDVVIRAFRNAGVDLQRDVHEDMAANFSSYPQKWGLSRPDTNIDHRRVPNLETYFARKGRSIPIGRTGGDFRPGDVVSWDLNGKGLTHIGLVSNHWNEKTGRYLIIHNIGSGTKAEDRLFDWTITGHFRYF